jgi:hypothetical protein
VKVKKLGEWIVVAVIGFMVLGMVCFVDRLFGAAWLIVGALLVSIASMVSPGAGLIVAIVYLVASSVVATCLLGKTLAEPGEHDG